MIYIYKDEHPELGMPRMVLYRAVGSVLKGWPVEYAGNGVVRQIKEPHPTAQFTITDDAGGNPDLGVKMVECLGFAQNSTEDGGVVKVWVQWHQRLAID